MTVAVALGVVLALVRHGNSAPLPSATEVRTCRPAASRVESSPLEVSGLTWSKDGKSIAGYSAYGTQVTIWNSDDWRQLHTFKVDDNQYIGPSIAFLSGTERLITPASLRSRDDFRYALSIWDVAKETIVQNVEGTPRPGRYAISADQRLLALTVLSYGGPASIYDLDSLKIVRSIPPSKNGKHDSMSALTFSSVGQSLALGKLSGAVDVYDDALSGEGDEFAAYEPDKGIAVGALAFSPDRKWLATGALVDHVLSDKVTYTSVKIWRTSDRSLIAEVVPRGGTVESLDWHPSGQYLAAAMGDHSLALLAPQTGQSVTIDTENSASVYAAAFSPGGQQLAAATGRGLVIFKLSR